MNQINKRFYISLLFCLSFSIRGQAQFVVNGSAVQTGNNCWTLTTERISLVGSIWNTRKIDLRESFDVSINVFAGCRDANGADGLVFGFQPVSTSIGGNAEGLGFDGVTPSIGFEIDTWQNTRKNDPPSDHIAIIKNGNLDHGTSNTLAGPYSLPNIEDCRFHDMQVNWNAQQKKLDVYWDCKLILTHEIDLVREIFNGDPFVFWGFTAATGGSFNDQRVCLKYSSFLDKLPDTTICQGSKVQLKANGGLSYEWSPRAGLDNPNIANPIARPVESTQYRVVISDTCGRKTFDSLNVKVGGKPFSFNLGNDTLLCEGESVQLTPSVSGARFTWQDGSTPPQYLATKTGVYGVQAERDFCYFTDSIRLKFTELPKATLTPDTTLCLGQKVTLTSPVEDGRYEWEDGSTQEKRFVTRSGVYTLVTSNRCGSASSTSNVIFDNCHEYFIPNVFSPNDDNVNDVLVISGNDIRRVLRFAIFSRWGNMVFTQNDFEANNALYGWTGGNVTPGVYTYFAEIEFVDGKIEVVGGDVTLMK